MKKTVVGLLKTRDEAQFAINDLINCGVQQDSIILRSSDAEHHVWSVEEKTDFEKGNRYLLTVEVDNDRAEEAAEIIRRHGAIEYKQGRSGWTAEAAHLEQPVRPRVSPENEPLSHATLSEQLERAEVFRDKEEVSTDVAGNNEQRFFGTEVSLPSSDIFQQHDIMQFEVKQRELQEGKVQERELRRPEAGAETEVAGPSAQSGQQRVDISAMGDEEFQQHFKATYGERGERFEEPYRSAYYFAEAESASHPQFVDKEWYEVEEEIHRDWEMSHPGTWSRVENAIHFGWDKTRRHH